MPQHGVHFFEKKGSNQSMQTFRTLAELAKLIPPPPDVEPPAPRIYDCTGCRFTDAHGLICDVCLRKILDMQAGQRKPSLLAACYEERGCVTLLRGRHATVM